MAEGLSAGNPDFTMVCGYHQLIAGRLFEKINEKVNSHED
jgi:hypothetical protein